MSNKILLLINLNGSSVGGAQKRYISLFNHLNRDRDDFFLVLNTSLYDAFLRDGLIESKKNVVVINLPYDSKYKSKGSLLNVNSSSEKEIIKRSQLRLFIGKNKTFIKLIISWVSFIFQFRRILNRIDSATVYGVWTGGVFAWPLRKIYGFKLIYSYNDSSLSNLSRKYWDFLNSEYWVLKKADQVDFLSEQIRLDLLKKKHISFNENRIVITPNSFINYTNHYSDEKDGSVVFLSRLVEIKNPILFLEAIKLLVDRNIKYMNTSFYILGEGRLFNKLDIYIENNQLDNVVLVGPTSEPWKYLRKSSIFISIQRDNNYPSQSLLEAMACENAIIASDVGETRKLVTENEGVLVNLNVVDLADAISKLLDSPQLCKQLGENSRRKVIQEHTIEKFMKYFIQLTNDINKHE